MRQSARQAGVNATLLGAIYDSFFAAQKIV